MGYDLETKHQLPKQISAVTTSKEDQTSLIKRQKHVE
jgi:hypothetical protein